MTALAALRRHWPEYLMEAAGLGLFMLAACLFTTLLEHPASPVRQGIATPVLRRVLMGLAMGATAVGIVYSRWGQQSGAHLNPSVTLTFLRLGKVARWDAAFYALAQVLGGAAGVAAAGLALGGLLDDPAVNHAVTQPGAPGIAVAFVAETIISFLLMTVVLATSNAAGFARFTGLFAGALVATYITLEAPLSGMSMNPARTLASALGAHTWRALWLYFVAPPLGMLLAAEVYRRLAGPEGVVCAKLHHASHRRCIFKCGYAVGALALVLFLASGSALAQSPAASRAGAVTTAGMTVSDLDRSVDFYSRVLGFEKESETEVAGPAYEHLQGLFGLRMRVARLRLGDERIELTEYLAPSTGRPIPPDSRSQDHWFQHIAIVVRDMEVAYRQLREHRVRHASSGPQRLPDWNPNAGGIEAFYFKDPDGHVLEVIAFPPGKGDPRWQAPSSRLFLGIDHTAIVVADTERSLAFYGRDLGLVVAGGSENHGTEQEHLNNVFGARLRITTLRAAAGPGIELLEYVTPRDGRSFPADTRANDLVHWHTTVVVGDLAAAAARVRAGRASLVSPGPVSLPDGALGFGSGLTVRDPDGHVMRLIP
jgi:glycerol uptake facilitator-like aquaporin/catechol 2,3-dioxygenase-like lactoylglutathione lyase family enzyme